MNNLTARNTCGGSDVCPQLVFHICGSRVLMPLRSSRSGCSEVMIVDFRASKSSLSTNLCLEWGNCSDCQPLLIWLKISSLLQRYLSVLELKKLFLLSQSFGQDQGDQRGKRMTWEGLCGLSLNRVVKIRQGFFTIPTNRPIPTWSCHFIRAYYGPEEGK
jgi:hypothetical protein